MKVYFPFIIILLAFVACEPKDSSDSTNEHIEKIVQQDEFDSLTWVNEQILNTPKNPQLYITKAKLFIKENQVEAGIAEIDRAILLDSTNIEYQLLKANSYYDANEMVLAKETYLAILAVDEQNQTANLKLAWISLIAGKHEECFVYSNAVLKVNQYLPEPYYIKGLAYKELGNFKLSVSNFRTATEQDNDYLEAWLQLGYLYDTAEDTLAGAYYENALRVDSNNIDALYAFGMHLQNWSISEEAIEQYQHILRVNDGYHNALYNIGFIYLEQIQNYDSAVKYYDQVLALNPYNYKAFYNRGLAFENQDKTDLALRDYNKSLEIKPDFELSAKGKTRILE